MLKGWNEACAVAIKSLEGDYINQRIVSINVSDEALVKALENPEISGDIST